MFGLSGYAMYAMRRVRWLVVLAIVAIGGCKSTDTIPTRAPQAKDQGRELLRQLEAARRAPDEIARAAAYFEALQLAERADNTTARRGIIGTLEENALILALPLHHRFVVNHLRAEDLIENGTLDTAADAIGRLVPADKVQLNAWRMVRIAWYEAAGQHYLAARELMRVTPVGPRNAWDTRGARGGRRTASDGRRMRDDWAEINGRLWRNLIAAPEHMQGKTPSDDVERGWWQLARIHLLARSNGAWFRQQQQWMAENPNHPATQAPPQAWPDIRPDARPDARPDIRPEVTKDPRSIGLFLPLSGPLAAAAAAIRDGFVAAYIKEAASAEAAASSRGGGVQRIRVYDTAQGIDNALAWAMSDGVDVIVGPLDKNNVEAMATRRIDIPVIALNRLDAPLDPRDPRDENCTPRIDDGLDGEPASCGGRAFLHIALAVEDDARAIRHALEERGLADIAVFESRQDWARRSRQELEAGSTTRIAAAGRLGDSATVTSTVAEVFGIDRSQARAEEVRRFLGIPIEFAPRRRDDIEAVVAFIDTNELTPLSPALAFHYADDLPLFVPSTAIRDAEDLRGMPRLLVPVATWQLYPTPFETETIEALQVSKPLLALGIDGYRLANRHRVLTRGRPLIGSTGILRLGTDGRVQRTLLMAEVSNGQIRAMAKETVDGLASDHRPNTAAR